MHSNFSFLRHASEEWVPVARRLCRSRVKAACLGHGRRTCLAASSRSRSLACSTLWQRATIAVLVLTYMFTWMLTVKVQRHWRRLLLRVNTARGGTMVNPRWPPLPSPSLMNTAITAYGAAHGAPQKQTKGRSFSPRTWSCRHGGINGWMQPEMHTTTATHRGLWLGLR